MATKKVNGLTFGSEDLRLPDELRDPIRAHLANLKQRYLKRGWGGRVGFGERPALIVTDLAIWWTNPANGCTGSDVESVVEASCRLLKAARTAGIPVFFTTWDHDLSFPPSPHDKKQIYIRKPGDERMFQLDPRMKRRPDERLLAKRYASAFKGTNLHDNLTTLGIDTLIVAG